MLNAAAFRRGQTFPIWAFGTLTVLALLAFGVNYGNSIYWQIRAQNAADAAAQGALSVQASNWNAIIADLHAAAIEEYRIRYIARDLAEMSLGTNQAMNATGCSTLAVGASNCQAVYLQLRGAFIAATNRYTQDVQMMETLNTPTFTNTLQDVKTAVANLQKNCASVQGGDCAFAYTVINPIARTTALSDVKQDAVSSAVGAGLPAPASLNTTFNPLQIEVIACAKIKPLFPAALNWINAPSFTAIGRAAATTIMATQEFMEVGAMVNPVSNLPFQPAEFPETGNAGPINASNNDPYVRIDYGGNINCQYGNCGNPSAVTDPAAGAYAGQDGNQAYDLFTGWWTAVAIPPYSGQVTVGQYSCN